MAALENYQGSQLSKYATQLLMLMLMLMLMLTGVRTIELRAAEWKEFNLDNALWEIPKERMKKLKVISGDYTLVFPGRNDVRKPMSEATINKVIKMIGYHGRLTGHGFRHMMSTILHEKGFDSAWIEMQLAHVDKNSIRGNYNHFIYIEQRQQDLFCHLY